MESRRTGVTVPGVGDTRLRFSRAALPVVLVGVALAGVATVGDGGVGRAHYLRQLVFGPASPAAARHHAAGAAPTPIPAISLAERALPRSPINGHPARHRRRGLLGARRLPRRTRQPPR
jgi:hypothetical protein